MTRVFLAAGVAALAISTPAIAGPHGGGHGGGNGGGGGFAQRQDARPQKADRAQMRTQRQTMAPQRTERMQMRAQRQAAIPQRAQRQAVRVERQEMRQQRVQQAQNHVKRQQMRQQRVQQAQMQPNRQQMRADRMQQAQNRLAQRQQMRADRVQQVQNRMAQRQQMQQNRQIALNAGQGVKNGYGVGGCPPGLAGKGCMPPGLARQEQIQALRRADSQVFRNSALQLLTPRTRILGPVEATQYIGAPLSTLSAAVPLMALPQSVNYLYPETPDYYYRYGDGYLYQVDRTSQLISALMPLLGGGYMPGTYLPSSYMNSYVPDYYGLNSFYPASYDYGYGQSYANLCNRYANGVVYQVDCVTGMVENVIPMYAAGYGVGQMIPSAYSYYNVPMQYRSMYYPTADYSYWYAPGAIYQYDTSSNLITSVAALMAPGLTVGQALPAGYGMYNVPLDYRSTYYDTPNAWYRYNNGYIYQVDPTTQLVTAIAASLLT